MDAKLWRLGAECGSALSRRSAADAEHLDAVAADAELGVFRTFFGVPVSAGGPEVADQRAQLVDDEAKKTLASSSSLKMSKKAGRELAKDVGADIGKKASEKNIKDVVFDRGGFVYHGRIQSLAEGAREAGLKF